MLVDHLGDDWGIPSTAVMDGGRQQIVQYSEEKEITLTLFFERLVGGTNHSVGFVGATDSSAGVA